MKFQKRTQQRAEPGLSAALGWNANTSVKLPPGTALNKDMAASPVPRMSATARILAFREAEMSRLRGHLQSVVANYEHLDVKSAWKSALGRLRPVLVLLRLAQETSEREMSEREMSERKTSERWDEGPRSPAQGPAPVRLRLRSLEGVALVLLAAAVYANTLQGDVDPGPYNTTNSEPLTLES